MPTDRRWDDDDRDEEFDDRPRRRGRTRNPADLIADARGRLAVPALLLTLSAAIMLTLVAANVAVLASGYDLGVAYMQYVAELQPAGPQKQQLEQQLQQMKDRDRTGEYVQGFALSAVGLAIDLTILLGGVRMRQVRGYGLALAGSICAIVPLNSCCCLGIPLGIWTLIVLLNPDVKAAFAANRPGVADAPGDDFDAGPDPDR